MAAHYVYTKNQGNQEKLFLGLPWIFKKKKKSKCYGVFIITYFHQKIINT